MNSAFPLKPGSSRLYISGRWTKTTTSASSLDRPGLLQIREQRQPSVLLAGAIKLAEDHNDAAHFNGETLEAVADFRQLPMAGLGAPGDFHELQMIDNDQA
jgi:hypothetical protein